jgi:general secretion pathway protein L
MHILSIDVGTYSVKYISCLVERKKITYLEMSEIIIRDFLSDHAEMSSVEAQASIVREIIDQNQRNETKIIYQLSHELITTRFIKLPVKNKKKAELMLPFQLEEDIPHSLSEIHYAYKLEPLKNQYIALTELIKFSNFENYYETFKQKNSLPNILTSEASILDTYFSSTPVAGPFCILDLGHRTTKCYLFYNSKLIVTHISFIGGQQINEMISKSYQIDLDEAIIYKHQNAFVLTSDQYATAESNQIEFAKTMDHFFAPLVADFMRWKIGLKVNFGLTISNVYICGGTSNIKNISNYLTEKFEIKVSPLDTFEKAESTKVDLNQKNITKFALANMLAKTSKNKNKLINFLTGKFAQINTTEIPLHSFTYLATRASFVSMILLLMLLGERFFIQKNIQFVNTQLTNVMKDPSLNISGRIRRSVTTNPSPVLQDLTKKQRTVRQDISTLQSSIEIDSLTPLVKLSSLLKNSNATLTYFKSNEFGELEGHFSAEQISDLGALKNQLENSDLGEMNLELNESKLTLKFISGK